MRSSFHGHGVVVARRCHLPRQRQVLTTDTVVLKVLREKPGSVFDMAGTHVSVFFPGAFLSMHSTTLSLNYV